MASKPAEPARSDNAERVLAATFGTERTQASDGDNRGPRPDPDRTRPSRRRRLAASRRRRLAVGLVIVFLAAAGLRLWHLDGHPGLEYDEPVYSSVAHNLADSGALKVREPIGVNEPYLYHPPPYFYALAGVYTVTNGGLTEARMLAAVMSLLSLFLLWLLARRWPGRIAGLAVVGLVAIDGWIVYTNRVAWIENTAMPLILGGLLLYDSALHTCRTGRKRALYLGAGAVLGLAMLVKANSVVAILAVIVHWLIVRRDTRRHLELVGVAVMVLATYSAVMTLVWGDTFIHQIAVQFDRSTGTYSSRGTVGLDVALRAFTHNYAIYVGTFALVLFAVSLIAWQIGSAVHKRSWEPLRGPDSLYLAWSIAAVVFLSALSIKFPHYAILLLIPLYLYAVSRTAGWVRAGTGLGRTGIVLACATALTLSGAVAYWAQIVSDRGNEIAQASAYVSSLPKNAVVLVDEPIGTLIDQHYLDIDRWVNSSERVRPDYVAVITTTTQKIPRDRRLARLLAHGRILRRFHGFKGDVTVYDVRS